MLILDLLQKSEVILDLVNYKSIKYERLPFCLYYKKLP